MREPRDRTDPPASPTATQQPRCSARVRTVAPQRGRIDPHASPALVLAGDGSLLAWRGDDATLFLTRLDASHERRADDRELARPARAFAMIAAPSGATMAYVERTPGGDDVVLLARFDAVGEARNVPRELGRGRSIEVVSIAPSVSGYAVAWSTNDPGNSGTHAVFTDGRGAPIAPERVVAGGTQPHLVYVPSARGVVLTTIAPPGDPTVALLDDDSRIRESAPWLAGVHGVSLMGGGSGVVGIALGADANSVLAPVSVRFVPSVGVTTTPLAFRTPSTTTVAGLVAERSGTVVLLDDGGQRETLSRIAADGTLSLLAVRAGHHGTVSSTVDGYVIAGLEPESPPPRGIDIVSLECPRPPPPTVVSATVNNVAASSSQSASATVTTDAATTFDASSSPPR